MGLARVHVPREVLLHETLSVCYEKQYILHCIISENIEIVMSNSTVRIMAGYGQALAGTWPCADAVMNKLT